MSVTDRSLNPHQDRLRALQSKRVTFRIRLLHVLLSILYLLTALTVMYLPLVIYSLRVSDLIIEAQFGNDDIQVLFGLLMLCVVTVLFVAAKLFSIALARCRVVLSGILHSNLPRKRQFPPTLRDEFAEQARRDALFSAPMLVAVVLTVLRLPLIESFDGWYRWIFSSLVINWMVLQSALLLVMHGLKWTPWAVCYRQDILSHSLRIVLIAGFITVIGLGLCTMSDSIKMMLVFPDSFWAVLCLIAGSTLLSIVHTQLAIARYER